VRSCRECSGSFKPRYGFPITLQSHDPSSSCQSQLASQLLSKARVTAALALLPPARIRLAILHSYLQACLLSCRPNCQHACLPWHLPQCQRLKCPATSRQHFRQRLSQPVTLPQHADRLKCRPRLQRFFRPRNHLPGLQVHLLHRYQQFPQQPRRQHCQH